MKLALSSLSFLAASTRAVCRVIQAGLRRSAFGASAFSILCLAGCSAPRPTIEITLCASTVVDGSCPQEFTQRKLQLPASYVAGLTPDARKAGRLIGDFRLNLRNIENLRDIAPTLSKEKELYRAIYEEVWVRAGTEPFEEFARRTDFVTPFYNHEYESEAARLAGRQWFEFNGFLVKRSRPQPQGPNKHEDLSPVMLKFSDGTPIKARCAKDLTLGQPVGCGIYDFRDPTLRLDYSSVVTTPELLKAVSDDIHRTLDKFTTYRRR